MPAEYNVTDLPFYGWLDGIIGGSTGVLIRTVALDTHLRDTGIPMSWQFNAQALMYWRKDLKKMLVMGLSRYSGTYSIHEVMRHEHIIESIASKVSLLRHYVDSGEIPACSCGRCG